MTTETNSEPRGGSRNLGTGFALGFIAAAAAGLLAFWALGEREAESASAMQLPADPPTTTQAPAPVPTANAAQAAEANPHGSPPPLPEAIAALIEEPRARLSVDPEDLQARKEIAVTLLRNGQLLPAFDEASAILARKPDDVDGLFVHGSVRVSMGQSRKALELLDRVLAQFPNHVLALMEKGKAHEKTGNLPLALATWERGLEAAGGSHAAIERLIAAAKSTGSPEELLEWLSNEKTETAYDSGAELAPIRSSANAR